MGRIVVGGGDVIVDIEGGQIMKDPVGLVRNLSFILSEVEGLQSYEQRGII